MPIRKTISQIKYFYFLVDNYFQKKSLNTFYIYLVVEHFGLNPNY